MFGAYGYSRQCVKEYNFKFSVLWKWYYLTPPQNTSLKDPVPGTSCEIRLGKIAGDMVS